MWLYKIESIKSYRDIGDVRRYVYIESGINNVEREIIELYKEFKCEW